MEKKMGLGRVFEIAGIGIGISGALIGVLGTRAAFYSLGEARTANSNTVAIARGIIHEEDKHDLVARVLNVTPALKGERWDETQPGIHIDLMLVNRGNKPEILRGLGFVWCDSSSFKSYQGDLKGAQTLNKLMPKGDIQVFRLTDRSRIMQAPAWVGVTISAIDPEARDVKRVIPICPVTVDWDSTKIEFEVEKTQVIQIVSNTPSLRL